MGPGEPPTRGSLPSYSNPASRLRMASRRARFLSLLEIPLVPLALGGDIERDDPRAARIQVLHETLDGAALARGVPSFEDHDKAAARVPDPVLQGYSSRQVSTRVPSACRSTGSSSSESSTHTPAGTTLPPPWPFAAVLRPRACCSSLIWVPFAAESKPSLLPGVSRPAACAAGPRGKVHGEFTAVRAPDSCSAAQRCQIGRAS